MCITDPFLLYFCDEDDGTNDEDLVLAHGAKALGDVESSAVTNRNDVVLIGLMVYYKSIVVR